MRRRDPEPWIITGSAFIVLAFVLAGEAFLTTQAAFLLGERMYSGKHVPPALALKVLLHRQF
jgi:hypothetical protein